MYETRGVAGLRIEVVRDPNGKENIPSVVYFKTNGETSVGSQVANSNFRRYFERVFHNAKRFVGRDYNS